MKKYLNGELAYDLESLTHKLELVEQQEDISLRKCVLAMPVFSPSAS
jgi:hypothetical protein